MSKKLKRKQNKKCILKGNVFFFDVDAATLQ